MMRRISEQLSFIAMLLVVGVLLCFMSSTTVAHATTDKQQQRLKQFLSNSNSNSILAGVAKVDATLPLGTPLAGYNHGKRRVPHWPLPKRGKYSTFMMPSEGIDMPTYAKCLVLRDSSSTPLAIITLDVIGVDGLLLQMAHQKAVEKGLDIPLENIIMSAAHTHSGPGAITPRLLWSLAPATDLLVKELQDVMVDHLADCLLKANANVTPAKVGIGANELKGVTRNRRADVSPYVTPDSIDPQLGIIRIDDATTNRPMATVWNFAIHGTCYGPDNMKISGDIMGRTNQILEEQIPGSVALFINSDAGDIAPTVHACSGAPDHYGSHIIADAVKNARLSVETYTNFTMQVYSEFVDFGATNLNLTLGRVANCTHGGILNICGICHYLNCDANIHLGEKWIETKPRFTSVRINIGGKTNVIVTNPGESLLELGNSIRADAKKMGADLTLLFGYSNAHMGYFAPADEYEIGGYESILTLWGENTAHMVRRGSSLVMNTVMNSNRSH